MATTRSLNSSDTAWVTTSAGKEGRSYTFSAIQGGERATASFTETELFVLLESHGSVLLDTTKPRFDRGL